jgi:hypothetical protein
VDPSKKQCPESLKILFIELVIASRKDEIRVFELILAILYTLGEDNLPSLRAMM